ncbi:MAG: M81 family metallopeptidase [Sphingorhabdus sp.]
MRVFAIGMGTETNSFCPLPTTREDYVSDLFEGFVADNPGPFTVWKNAAAAAGVEFARGSNFWAYPAGPTSADTLAQLTEQLSAEVRQAGAIDILLLNLHGAMMALGEDDCEGALLETLRGRLPKEVIFGVLIDPHAHLTARMVAHCDVLIAYKEFPHDDIADRADELFTLCLNSAMGKIRPIMEMASAEILCMINTKISPGADLVATAKRIEERPNILSASIIQGFAWGDGPDLGAKALVVADKDIAAARSGCNDLVAHFQAIREEIAVGYAALSVDDAITAAVEDSGTDPVILCEPADNITGGGAGDATHILKALVARKVASACFAPIWDPIAVDIAIKAGVGARLMLRMGGKSGLAAGRPVDAEVEIIAIRKNYRHTVSAQKDFPAGDTVHVRTNDGLDIILSVLRFPILAPSIFTDFGIDLAAKKIVSIKGFQMARVQFSSVSSHYIEVMTDGAMGGNVFNLPYKRAPRNLWPLNRQDI